MSNKHPIIETILEEISGIIGTPRSTAFSQKLCVMCNGDASSFKNELSEKEYSLSGMCQKCQDGFFDQSEEE
tara:strand:+ start:1617 stop:1832 length:216 start_codon:yes stop_codon:yes gene_type:complete